VATVSNQHGFRSSHVSAIQIEMVPYSHQSSQQINCQMHYINSRFMSRYNKQCLHLST